jgi:hypothetical protein
MKHADERIRYGVHSRRTKNAQCRVGEMCTFCAYLGILNCLNVQIFGLKVKYCRVYWPWEFIFMNAKSRLSCEFLLSV